MKKSLLFLTFGIFLFGDGGMDNLNMPSSARIMGFGGVYTPIFGGINSAIGNPAGLAGDNAIMSSYMNAMGINYLSVGKSQPRNENSTLAYGFISTFTSPMVRTNETGESLGVFRYTDLLPYISYENGLPKKFTWGITGKIFYRNVPGYYSAGRNVPGYYSVGLGVDAGILYKIMGNEEDNFLHSKDNMLWSGICIKNLGYVVKPFDAVKEIFPAELKIGLSYVMKNSIIAFDYTTLPKTIAIGYEVGMGKYLTIRGGITTKFNEMKIGDQSDILNGLGFGFTTRAKNITVDYATVFTALTSPLQMIEIHF